jgi:hypothetical protein
MILISESLQYHLNNGLSLMDSPYLLEDDKFHDLVNEVRKLWELDELELWGDDLFLVERLKTGVRAKFKGASVVLDSPNRNPDNPKKKFQVYTDSGRKDKEGNIIAKKIEWGHADYQIRNGDRKAAKSFWARMQCDSAKDPKTPKFWACWAPSKFGKKLGLSSTAKW